MRRVIRTTTSCLFASMLACPVLAAVVDFTPTGFAIEVAIHIAAPPDKVYAALIRPALWWNSQHTFSQDAANLTLDARGGGCFCEKLPNGGSVQHAVVVDAEPGDTLRLRGPLGPFQGQGVDSAITFSLKPAAGGTDLALDNIVGGYMNGGFADWPAKADGMLADQLARLKMFVETGSPTAKP
jgi:uncharacterized protein YndB with AHSA1/START domain